jgi:hypothetical protein
MGTYRTMTVGGIYGSTIEADSWTEAIDKAEAPPISEEVLDCIEHNGENVLVVADLWPIHSWQRC